MTIAQTHRCHFKNLVVSGCSFSTAGDPKMPSSWPEFLQISLGIENFFPLARNAAGNRQISQSLIWCLENNQIDAAETLVIVMFSGNDRDDEIVDVKCIKDLDNTNSYFLYSNTVAGACTGGQKVVTAGNTKLEFDFKSTMIGMKNNESRAIENYLHTVGVYNYLQNKDFSFVLTNFLDPAVPNRSMNFDIRYHLPEGLVYKYDSMLNTNLENIYTWSCRHNMLQADDFHPSYMGHLSWTNQVLIPYLKTKFDIQKI